MGSNAEIKAKYESLMKSASALYLDKQYQKASLVYIDALKFATDSNMSKVIICILKYMICCCLYESDKLEDLAEAVHTLQAIDRTVKNRFPAVYCLLAKTHCKLYRFELAEMEFRNADAIFSRNPTLESFCIPGTDQPIRPISKDDEAWAKIKEECTAYHKPDAICSFPDCNYVAKPYVIPNKNIFLKDPAFNGMVVVNCNNKDQPCVLKFHQSCWKMKKDELFPITKVSDKDILGENCFTPSCLNDDVACVISSIQVIDQNGELKAHIKENPASIRPVKPQEKVDKNASKGAIKKMKITSAPKKPDNPLTVLQQQLLDSINKSKSRAQTNSHQDDQDDDDMHYYDESQVIVVKDGEDVDFSHEPSEVAGEKSFLFTLFFDYIKKNKVTIGDVYLKFNEYNQDLSLKDLDILGFLLHTNRFEVVQDNNNTAACAVPTEEIISQPNESFKSKGYDDDATSFIDDVYYELTNDKEEVFEDCTENTEPMKNYNFLEQDYHLNVNLPDTFQSSYNHNNSFPQDAAAGGDASGHLKNNNLFTPHQSFESCAKIDGTQSYQSSPDGIDNRELKDYITKLENDVDAVITENSILRKENAEQASELESLKKKNESYQEQMQKCEELFETWADFQKAHDKIKKELVEVKEELVQAMKEKHELIAKIAELEDPEIRRSEFMKHFQEQLQELEQVLNGEWENKTEILKRSLGTEIEVRMKLLNKLLNTQYTSHKHLLTGYLERCSDFVETTTKVNVWIEKAMNVKNFLNNSEWLARLEILQKAADDLKNEYSGTLRQLHAEKEEKFKMTDISLKTPAIPNAPNEKLCDVILKALNAYYTHQYQIMQNYAMKAQAATQAATQAMQYQSQAYNTAAAAAYVSPYANYAASYPAVQPTLPSTPLTSVPSTPAYAWTPRTTPSGTPPNLTVQQTTPTTSQPPPPLPLPLAKSQASTPFASAAIEKPKAAVVEQTAPAKAADVSASKETVEEDAKDEKVEAPEKADTFEEKFAQMRDALKTIALSVKEKSKTDKPTPSSTEQKEAVKAPEKVAKVEHAEAKKAPEKTVRVEPADVKKPAEKVAAPPSKVVTQVTDHIEKAANIHAQSVIDSMSIRDDRSDITTLTSRDDSKSQKKVGMDGLVKMLLRKFPGAMECDVIEAIAKIRKERNNALTGISVSRIIEEAKPHIQNSQRSHVIRYTV